MSIASGPLMSPILLATMRITAFSSVRSQTGRSKWIFLTGTAPARAGAMPQTATTAAIGNLRMIEIAPLSRERFLKIAR
jgi:hypothetical protein